MSRKRGGRQSRTDQHDARGKRGGSRAPLPESVGNVVIERIAAGGDGVGRIEGLACFVPRTAPGDAAQVAFVTHARHARGRVLQLLQPSPVRVVPACRHYTEDQCGGCQLQHLSHEAQLQARVQLVQDTVQRIGKRDVPLPGIVSDVQWGYRGRLTLTLVARGRSWIGGLHPHNDASRVFNLEECPIAHPSLVQTWHDVRRLDRGLPQAPSLRLGLRLLTHDVPGVAVIVEGGTNWLEAAAWGGALLKAAPQVQELWWIATGAAPALVTAREAGGGDVAKTLLRDELPDRADVRTGGATASPAGEPELAPQSGDALAFAQVNASVAASLRTFVAEQVRRFSPQHVVDAYAGVGVLAEQLAADGVQVTAIEADRAGADATRRRFDALGEAIAQRTRVMHALVEDALPDALGDTSAMAGAVTDRARADVVLLNPPRRGVDARVTTLLDRAASRGVRAIVYVSCDPATLARDLSRLPSWKVAALQCYDMFPQTAHVETVCVLQPEVA